MAKYNAGRRQSKSKKQRQKGKTENYTETKTMKAKREKRTKKKTKKKEEKEKRAQNMASERPMTHAPSATFQHDRVLNPPLNDIINMCKDGFPKLKSPRSHDPAHYLTTPEPVPRQGREAEAAGWRALM
ncbi:hypothetical protein BaRGS_00004017 [Batillaria attramentaria]|uniref:Uncharacterized protein n=1 Tax=Batillaria attramentaria TaxID=370345 RepID=A0ABD0LZR2_9CAEN